MPSNQRLVGGRGLGVGPSLCPWWQRLIGTCFLDIEAQRLEDELNAATPIKPPPVPPLEPTGAAASGTAVDDLWAQYYEEQHAALAADLAAKKPKCAWYQTPDNTVVEGCRTNTMTVWLMAGGVGIVALLVFTRR